MLHKIYHCRKTKFLKHYSFFFNLKKNHVYILSVGVCLCMCVCVSKERRGYGMSWSWDYRSYSHLTGPLFYCLEFPLL